jgi:PucR-like helix-turn-helix protein/diguanylate cyclase with GGDEF domain
MGAVDDDFARLAAKLGERLESISAAAVAQARRESPEWLVERSDLGDLLPAGTHESIGAELAALCDEARVPDRLPDVDAGGARLIARHGVPLSLHLSLYRIGHAAQWQAWFELVEAEEPDPDRRRELLARGSRFFFAYAGRISQLAGAEHERERERLLRSHEQRRVHVVRELLDGRDEVDADALDYPLDAHHLGLVIAAPDAAAIARALADRLERRLLLVELLQDTWWAWLGGRRALERRPAELLRTIAPSADARVAAGDDAAGVAGFRRSHREAIDAHRLGRRLGRSLTTYDDVALEALLARTDGDAARFAARELRGIDDASARSAILRRTLASYFAHGQNAAATAAALDVHEQTVAKRLRTIEERVGRPVTSRRAELEIALRVSATVSSAD